MGAVNWHLVGLASQFTLAVSDTMLFVPLQRARSFSTRLCQATLLMWSAELCHTRSVTPLPPGSGAGAVAPSEEPSEEMPHRPFIKIKK